MLVFYARFVILFLSVGAGLLNPAQAQNFLSCHPANQGPSARHCPITLSLGKESPQCLWPIASRQCSPSTRLMPKVEESLNQVITQLDMNGLFTSLGFHPSIKMIEDPIPNAFATSNHFLIISSGLFDLTTSLDELAYVVAHELGHMVLHLDKDSASGIGRSSPNNRLKTEMEADGYALQLLQQKGFETGAALSLLAKLTHKKPDDSGHVSVSLPGLQNRMEVLESLINNEGKKNPPRAIKEFMRKPDMPLEPPLKAGEDAF